MLGYRQFVGNKKAPVGAGRFWVKFGLVNQSKAGFDDFPEVSPIAVQIATNCKMYGSSRDRVSDSRYWWMRCFLSPFAGGYGSRKRGIGNWAIGRLWE